MSAATITSRPTFASGEKVDHQERFEIIDGLRLELPPMSAEASVIASDLARHLSNYGFAQNRGRGVSEVLFHLPLPTDRNRRPDAAFVPFTRWPRGRRIPSSSAWDVLPDVVAEVISPFDLATEVLEKIAEYFQSGIQLVWVIYPSVRLVYVYESLLKVRGLTRSDTLEGGTVLPGFQLALAELFPDETV